MKVAVAGGTGEVGKHVVARLADRGHEPVVLARAAGVDLMTGEGLAAAMRGADAVIDVVSTKTTNRPDAVRFFTSTTRRLLENEEVAGVRHHVVLSIVGIDDVPLGYYQGKVAQEQAVEAGSGSWTLLRATQFHEFAVQNLETVTVGPVAFVPNALAQPVAASEVAAHLVALALAAPAGRVPDLAGPEKITLPEMIRGVVRAKGLSTRVVPLPVPGRVGRALRRGALTPSGPGPRGTTTFAAYLASLTPPITDGVG